MAGFAKWIGGGLGWALGGPIGGILGFVFGSMVDGMQSGKYEIKQPTQRGDFSVSLLVLTASVMRADGKVLVSELNYVKRFLLQQFGPDEAERQLLLLREIIKQDYNLADVCRQIKSNMEYSSRLQLLHLLFGISQSDGQLHASEVSMIEMISGFMGITSADFASIRAMFVKDTGAEYSILEVPRDATDEEVRKAYRKMAMKYHPDKVAHLGEDMKNAAEQKFRELNRAYEAIKKERGMN